MIRDATHADIPRLVEMGGRFIASSQYGKFFADNATARRDLMARLIDHPDGALFGSEKDGALVGMIGVYAYQHPWSGERIGGEVFWWVEPEARGRRGMKLRRRAEQWAADAGCVRFQMIAPNEKVARAYRRLGYAKLEECYQRDI